MAEFNLPTNMDQWLLEDAPRNDVVISSRARLARNLPHLPFAAHATQTQLIGIAERIGAAFHGNGELAPFAAYELGSLDSPARTLLRESHLISTEQEKGGIGRMVYLSPSMDTSVMINEEDHLRLSSLVSGLRVGQAYERIGKLEEAIERKLQMAYSDEFGYLTACPTNTGTGLRLSVMLHMPALAMVGQVEDSLSNINSYGLIVRGAYGEHTENTGDMFQISNEVTLGKSERQIMQTLEKVVRQIIDREMATRELLLKEAREKVRDAVCRALGILGSARQMTSAEAATLLSRTRLGVAQDWGMPLSHAELNRLFVQIQPAHLRFTQGADDDPDKRDLIRADYLRSIFRVNGQH
ncbi:ATP--guanido phosphotransferase [bacterium]|nr:ATP--guanido phosphotransferase [bacterium]